jgi:hypothetical protein
MPLALTRLAIRSRERSERLAKDGGVWDEFRNWLIRSAA